MVFASFTPMRMNSKDIKLINMRSFRGVSVPCNIIGLGSMAGSVAAKYRV
jgi:hypothetical protein